MSNLYIAIDIVNKIQINLNYIQNNTKPNQNIFIESSSKNSFKL